jgi:DNA polymerase I-like protein with 3'-5' exonuclease and polymerase domains
LRNRALSPGPGKVFIKVDFSAFQLRLLAHLSQDPTLIDLFAYLEGVKRALESSPEGQRYVRSIRGRRRGFSHPGELTDRERRQAANAVVQMLEADVFKKTVLELDAVFKRERLPVEIVLLIHDGIWFVCPQEVQELAKSLIRQVMENSVSVSVPLAIDFA